MMATPLFEIVVSARNDTVWVNGHDGSCIARFSKRGGIDVHTLASDQMAGASECLYCTHAPAGQEEWATFREMVLKHHGIDVHEKTLVF